MLGKMKGGAGILDASYQLKLQISFAFSDGKPYRLVTDRPLSPTLKAMVDIAGEVVAPC